MKNQGLYYSLEAQLNKIARHNRQGSYRTKERYYMAMKRFCHFLADEYHLQKLSNISSKHLVAYVLWMQEKELSASTIKTDLAAIRFFHDKISNAKYTLPTNAELGVELERRRFGVQDRTWSTAEFNRMLELASENDGYLLAFHLARYAGLRIHECFRIDTAIARQAIREHAITIKGKGGKSVLYPLTNKSFLLWKSVWKQHRQEANYWCRRVFLQTRPLTNYSSLFCEIVRMCRIQVLTVL